MKSKKTTQSGIGIGIGIAFDSERLILKVAAPSLWRIGVDLHSVSMPANQDHVSVEGPGSPCYGCPARGNMCFTLSKCPKHYIEELALIRQRNDAELEKRLTRIVEDFKTRILAPEETELSLV